MIQPTEGVFEEDDLYGKVFIRPHGGVFMEKATPVDLTDTQRLRLFSQCYSVAEYLARLTRRDCEYMSALIAFEDGAVRGSRPPRMPTSLEVAEALVVELHCEQVPTAQTVMKW